MLQKSERSFNRTVPNSCREIRSHRERRRGNENGRRGILRHRNVRKHRPRVCSFLIAHIVFVLFFLHGFSLVIVTSQKLRSRFGHTQAAMCEFSFRGAMKLAKSNEEFFFHDFAWFCPYITLFQSHSTLHISATRTGRRKSRYMQSLLVLEHLSSYLSFLSCV